MSAAREEVLGAIRSALGEGPGGVPKSAATDPAGYRVASPLDRAELSELFRHRVGDYRATVRDATPASVADVVAAALSAHGAAAATIPADLPPAWHPAGLEAVPDSLATTAAELDRVGAVVSGSALAIAETGTIVLDGGAGQGRRALSLVPDLHVCVVAAGSIVATVPEAFAALAEGGRDAHGPLTFVSGPSATSDIELSRVEGVHGPRLLEVVLLAA